MNIEQCGAAGAALKVEYVYLYAVKAGRDAWKWRQKGTLVWASAGTEKEAIEAIHRDAAGRGVRATITNIGLMRPRAEKETA